MSRHPRLYVPGLRVHVFPRGIDRIAISKDDYDRQHLLSVIRRVALRRPIRIHAFAIMKTHYHLIATPEDEFSLGKAMQTIGISHTKYFNRRHGRTGTLWNERFDSSLLDT